MKNLLTRKSAPAAPVSNTIRQVLVVVGLAAIAIIHLLDLPAKLQETPYLGVSYIFIILGAIVLMERIVLHKFNLDLLAAAGLSISIIVGFVINRTVGMPGAMGDIGNWTEPLGMFSLVVEGLVAWNALRLIQSQRANTDVAQFNYAPEAEKSMAG